MIKCGHCKTHHESIDRVRACSQAHQAGYRARQTYAAARTTLPSTERATFGNGRPHLPGCACTRCRPVARPVRPARTALPSIPAGRYGIRTSHGTLLINVDRPVGGRWDGYTFLNLVNADGSEGDAIRDRETRERYIRAIAGNLIGAAEHYGRATKRCSECHRRLKTAESKRRGIGPVCAQRLAHRAQLAAQHAARI